MVFKSRPDRSTGLIVNHSLLRFFKQWEPFLPKKNMKSLEPWLNRTVLRTVAGYCGSYGSVLKQIYSLKRHSAGIYTDQKTDINRERIWKAKNRKKKKWKERRNREKKKKKNHITSVDHGNALPLIDRFSFFPFISFGFLKTFFTSSLSLRFTCFFFFGLLLRLFRLLPF